MATTTHSAPQYLAHQDVKEGHRLEGVQDLTDHLSAGDYLSATLVTDTVVYQVVKVTAKTVTLQECRQACGAGYIDDRCDNGPAGLDVRWYPVELDPDAKPFTRRLAKDGTLKVGSYARAGRYCVPMTVNGQAVARLDWRF